MYDVIKKTLGILSFVIISNNALAQTKDSLINDFGNSILKKLNYPNELIARCTPTFAVLKIKVDGKGEITEMKLSDSADPLFIVEWLSKMKDINTTSLKSYIKQHAIFNRDVLLPINYTFSSKSCSSMNIDQNSLLRLFKFENKELTEPLYILPPLNLYLKFSVNY